MQHLEEGNGACSPSLLSAALYTRVTFLVTTHHTVHHPLYGGWMFEDLCSSISFCISLQCVQHVIYIYMYMSFESDKTVSDE